MNKNKIILFLILLFVFIVCSLIDEYLLSFLIESLIFVVI